MVNADSKMVGGEVQEYVQTGRFQYNGVFRSSPQTVCRDDPNEAGCGKRFVTWERAVKQNDNDDGRWDNRDQGHGTTFCKDRIPCNFQTFAEAFLLSSTCVFSWQCSRLWKYQHQLEIRKKDQQLYELFNTRPYTLAFNVFDGTNQQKRKSTPSSLKYLQCDASTNLPIEADSIERILQNDAKFHENCTHGELLGSYSAQGSSSSAYQQIVKEKRRVRFVSCGDVINQSKECIEESKISTSDSESATDNLQESHHEQLYAEFEENWKALCERYVKMKHNKRGVLAAENGNSTAALSHFETAGTAGCARAQFNLGLLYQTGNGCVQNLTMAVECYKEAVRYGSVEAAHNLALIYLNRGQNGDHLQALKLLHQSASGGFAPSKTELGVAYIERGNLKEAVKLFADAAKEQDADAQFFLALCYENGLGVERNECKAAELYDKASKSGHTQAQCQLGYFFEHGLGGVPIDLNSAEALYKMSADNGNFQAERGMKRVQTESAALNSDSSWIKDLGSMKLRHCVSAPSLFSCLQSNLLTISLADWGDESDDYSLAPTLVKNVGTLKDKCGYNDSGGGDGFDSSIDTDYKETAGLMHDVKDSKITQCDSYINARDSDVEDKREITPIMAMKRDPVLFTLGDNAYENNSDNPDENCEDSEISWCSSSGSSAGLDLDGRFGTVVDLSKNKSLKRSTKKKSAYDLLLLGGGFGGSVTNLSKTKATKKKKSSKGSLLSLSSESDLSITFDENCINPALFSLSDRQSGNPVRLP